MDNVAEDLLLVDFTKVAASRILVGAKCIPDNVFRREYKLSFRACNCQSIKERYSSLFKLRRN